MGSQLVGRLWDHGASGNITKAEKTVIFPLEIVGTAVAIPGTPSRDHQSAVNSVFELILAALVTPTRAVTQQLERPIINCSGLQINDGNGYAGRTTPPLRDSIVSCKIDPEPGFFSYTSPEGPLIWATNDWHSGRPLQNVLRSVFLKLRNTGTCRA